MGGKPRLVPYESDTQNCLPILSAIKSRLIMRKPFNRVANSLSILITANAWLIRSLVDGRAFDERMGAFRYHRFLGGFRMADR